MSLTILLATGIAFSFGSADSWAAISLTQLISQPPTQIATMNPAEAIVKNIGGKAQEVMSNITGEAKTPTDQEVNQFKAKTLEGYDKSIENPDYQPGGKTKQAEKEATEIREDIKAEGREAFK